ncbi:zf-HC2 domain-containing protein [Intestinibacter bartlettii]|uniref:Zf-HC2 domain-containing protein n=1 Tax=Intestinibacter bartlettii TaxID=261299 RepID=A0ABS6DTP7_9FIRM|nr:zf-HC2 domain-containing protein [Intestinibacter bartlettii]MBU5335215.1 zf-HC2 domain-containing protein [Intestinibacter bartlettii]MDO5011492.1 zf-HC2 domain-containing protein [Intestinibacter bartlettii]
MSKLKCSIVEDLMPLYIEDLLSEETKKDIELHLDECEDCKEVYDELKEDVNLEYEKKIDLKEDEYEELKTDTLDSIKNYLNKIKYILIIFSMAVSVGISILGNGFLSTIPWIVIIPFVLRLLYKENILIIATAFIFNVLFNIVLQSADAIIFDSIYILLCTGAGLFLASSIKNLKTN